MSLFLSPFSYSRNVDTCRLWWWPILWWRWRLSAGRRRWRRPLVVARRSNLHTSTTDMTFDERQTDDEIFSDTTRLLRRPFLDSQTGPAVRNERPKWRFHWQHHVSLTISLHSQKRHPHSPLMGPNQSHLARHVRSTNGQRGTTTRGFHQIPRQFSLQRPIHERYGMINGKILDHHPPLTRTRSASLVDRHGFSISSVPL